MESIMRNIPFRRYKFIKFMAALGICSMSLADVAFAQDYETGEFGDYAMPVRFYLSTKRIFQPGEDVQVELESSGTADLELRVYKLDDPLSYLQTLADPHRPKYKNGNRRQDGKAVLGEMYHNFLNKSYFALKSELGPGGNRLASGMASAKSCEIRQELQNYKKVVAVAPLTEKPLLFRTMVALGDSAKFDWTYRSVALPVKEPGTYLVEATANGKVAHTVVVISELSMVVKQDGVKTTIFVANAATGAPVKEAQVEIYDQNKTKLGSAVSDENGLAVLDTVPANSLVFVKAGNNIALADPRFYPASQTSGERLYIFTERPVYKPEQEVYFKGIIRNMDNDGWQLPSEKTVEVVALDPQDHEFGKQNLKITENGTFSGTYKLAANVVYGTHRLVAKYKGQVYSGEFTVKHYVKPTYKVEVGLAKEAYHFNEKVQGTISGSYFSGGALAGADVSYEVFRTKFYVPWWLNADYKWYYNDTESYNSIKEKYTEGNGKLDGNGQFQFEFQLQEGDSDYTYEVVATVKDQQERPIVGRRNFKVTVGEFYLNLLTEKLIGAPGKDMKLSISAKDYGQAAIANQDISIELLAANGEGSPIQTWQAVTDKKGHAEVVMNIAAAGVYKLKATAKTSISTVTSEQQVIISSSDADIHYVPDQLQVVVDKRGYQVGDKVQTLVIAPFAEGYVLATAEGGRLYESQILKVKNYTASWETTVTKSQEPNFQVAAAAINAGQLYQNSRSVIVPPANRFLKVTVNSAKKQYYPRDKATVEIFVTDQKGKPIAAELAVAAVDEAIYSVQPELALTLEEFFYEKRRNNIRTTFSQLFRFYGYSEEAAAAMGLSRPPHSFGAEKVLAKDVRRLFRDTAYWQGIVKTNKEGKAEVSFDLPDNLTSWRVTAWAITPDTKVGKGFGNFITTQEVEVMVSGPSYLVAGDKATYQVLARNNQSKEDNININLTSAEAAVSGEAKKVNVPASGIGGTVYEVNASKQGNVTLLAKGEGTKSDAMEVRIPVYPAGMEQNIYAGGLLMPQVGAVDSQSLTLNLPENGVVDSAKLEITGYSAMLGSLVSSLEYLTTYPYGCVEQTMSGFLPDVIAHQTLKKLGIAHKELESKLDEYIAAGLTRLAGMMNYGWGWWGGQDGDFYMTAYVTYGLAMAKRAGIDVPADMLENGCNMLNNQISWNDDLNPNAKALALYALSLSGKNVNSNLRKVGTAGMSRQGKIWLALAYQSAKMADQAAKIINDMLAELNESNFFESANDIYEWYEDPVETAAMLGRAMLATGVGSETQLLNIMGWLFKVREGDFWQSTRDTAAVVYFLSEYYNKYSAALDEVVMSAELNGQPVGKASLKGREIFQQENIKFNVNGKNIAKNNELLVSATGGQLVFNADMSFYGETPVKALSKTFGVERHYYEVNTSGEYKQGAEVSKLKQGQLYLVEVSVTPLVKNRSLHYVMLEDALPAGVEVMEQDNGIRVSDNELTPYGFHREIMPGKVAYFVSELSGTETVRYLVRALYNGTYTAMPAKASLMYFPKQQGYSASQQITISK